MADLNLPVVVFLIVLLTQLVAWVGKTALQEFAFGAYTRFFLAGTQSRQKRLRAQVLQDKAELAKTSSQDEFAKWAKLRRKVDKGLADLETTNTSLSSARAAFGLRFSSLIWVVTTGASFFLVWWYRRVPVFWLPAGWVPGPVAWVLAFPGAPRGKARATTKLTPGSVSVGAWSTVCKQVLLTAEGIVKALLAPTPGELWPDAQADLSG
ncbi:protein GET1 [Cutaneotrichosporon oleaginosum]|uniref:Protein GET1 n=1 Tax=Cutaneotrichosporon oleaginosum TaxID=879819 RepID=A0A0J0XG98_9TREE|nr:protein GET1 [Cutaneotrichosporon oleaginosum]KLT40083.1 protein GET1 [Cutaneotrichosporon oleaginosum]TXT10417.1 hypothetical protein COLE_04351 [Cutaneotrichosporon oleaginosum]